MNAKSPILRLFLSSILLAGFVTAQSIPDIQLRIEGPNEVQVGSSAVFKAVVEADELGAALVRDSILEWIFNGKVVQRGPVFEYRADRAGAWQIKVRLVQSAEQGGSLLANSTRTLMATREATPVARPAPAAPVAKPAAPTNAYWLLVDSKEETRKSLSADSRNRVSFSGASCLGTHEVPCSGKASALLRWTQPPASLAPGATLEMELTDELELAVDGSCPSPGKPLQADMKATWLVRKGSLASQAAVTLSETAKQASEKFTKSKKVEWPAPAGEPNETLVVEIRAESPAGTASKFYTYVFKTTAAARAPAVRLPADKSLPVSVALVKESPKGDRVLAGEPAVFRASLLSGASRVENAFVLRWRAEPAAIFKLDGVSASAVFTKPGPAQIWCEAFRGAGLAEPLAVSDRASLDVVGAQLGIEIEPAAPRVGEEAKATVQATNVFKGIEMHWLPLPSNARLVSRSKDGRVTRFYMADASPAQFQIQTRQPGGAVLGGASVTVQAKSYEVSISGPVPGSPVPQLWVPGAGLVKVTDALAVDQNFFFEAAVKGAAKESALTFLWDARDAGCSIRTPVSRQADVVCTETGRFTIGVTVRDERGVELGKATTQFEVAISQEQLQAAWGRAKADQLARDGAALEQQGRTEEAAVKYRESLVAWADDTIAKRAQDLELAAAATRQQKARFAEMIRAGHELEQKGDFSGAVQKYRESLAIQTDERLENHITQLESEVARREADRAQARALRAQADEFSRKGRLGDAVESLTQSLLFEPDAQVEQQVAQLETQIAEQASKKAKALQWRGEGDALEQAGDLEGALEKLKESLAEWPDEGLKARVEVLEQSVTAEKNRAEKAARLKEDGVVLEGQGDSEGAVSKYRKSLALRSDDTLKARVEQLDLIIAQKKALAVEAAGYRDEGFTFETQGKLDEALSSYRRSLEKAPDGELEQRVKDLQTKIAERDTLRTKARELVDQASKLEQEGQLRDAVEACRQSLVFVSDPVVRSRVAALENKLAEQEAKQSRAAELALEAQTLKEQGDLAAAVAKYRESLTAWPDAELESRVRDLEGELEAENALQTKVKELVTQAEALELEGKAEEAITKYRESLGVQANNEIENRIDALQKEIAERQAVEERAAALKAQAELLEQEGQLAEAVSLYRQSQELLPDADLAKRADDLEKKLAEEEGKKTEAARLAKEAFDLERQGRVAEALAKHKESLAQWPDTELEKRAAILEDMIAAETARKGKAVELKQAGAALEKTGNLEGTVARYRASLDMAADAELLKHVQELEAQVAAEQTRLAKARDLMEEGRRLELDGKSEAAAEQYRASLALEANGELQVRLSALEREMTQREATVAEAQRLKQQGAELAMDGRVMEAIRAYRQSIALVPDSEAGEQVATLQASLAQQETRKTQAAKLSKEAYDLERQGQIAQALVKHKESLAQWPDADLEKRVRTLESMLAADAARKTRAAELRQAGAALEQQGSFAAAAAKYRASLGDVFDAELEKKVAALDRSIAQQRADQLAAKRLRQEAAQLEDNGLLAEAVATLKDSLKLDPDAKIQNKVISLEARRVDEQGKIKQARDLTAEAFKKEKAGDFEGAIALFRESMNLVDDESVDRHVASLEAALAVETAKKDQAQRLKEEGYSFEQQGARDQAIQKYRESLDLWPNNELAVRLSSLQGSMTAQVKTATDAGKLREQARSLEQKGDLQAAIGKYGESVKIARDPAAEQHIVALQKQVDLRQKNQGKADELWKEGIGLLSEKRTREAVISMRMSLQYLYMDDRARYLKQVEAQQVSTEPRSGAAVKQALPLAGTSWVGVMLIRGRNGTMQWPIRLNVGNDNSIKSDYKVEDITSTKRFVLHIEGSYVPLSRRFNLQFQQSEQGQVSIRGALSGEALTTAVAGGDARLSTAAAGAIAGTGVWRIARE